MAPTYDYDDEIFKTFGIVSMTTPRPAYGDPAQAVWDTTYAAILAKLNEKIQAYNAEARAHNAALDTNGKVKIKDYTIIRTNTTASHEEVQTTNAGIITSGGDMIVAGSVENHNSRIISGKTMSVGGALDNDEFKNQERKVTFGTTQQSYTKKKPKPHKAWRRRYRAEIFMTPQVESGNAVPLGVAKIEGNTARTPDAFAISQSARENVQNDLNPFAPPAVNISPAGTSMADTSFRLPESSIYNIHPESTSGYLVETDPAFINKKKFLSSDYMYEQMKRDPDKTMKRLGDGFYEQELVRQQIMSLRGTRYLPGYTGDEEEYKALMESGAAFARKYDLKPGIALTKEQMAALTSDIVWLETKTVIVGGKPVDVIYPHVYLCGGRDMRLGAEGSLISAEKLVIDTKDSVRNAGSIYGKSVIIQADHITNLGYVGGGSIALSAKTDIEQGGFISGEDKAALTAGRDIRMKETVQHLKNQDVLDRTAGIAVSGKEGVLLVGAGRDIALAGAALSNLGEKGSTILKAGGNIGLGTDALTAGKDMTENRDNYIRTYRKTETGNTIAAKGDIALAAGENITVRNSSISSESGRAIFTANQDITVENGEKGSRNEYGIKYKERGFLSSKTTIHQYDQNEESATGSLISGKEVQMAAGRNIALRASAAAGENDVALTAGNDITADSAAQKTRNMDYRQVKKSGLIGSGLGFTIGSEKKKDSYDTEETVQRGSTVGSVKGSVTIAAGQTASVRASDIIAGKDTLITGRNVDIESKDNTYKGKEEHEYKKSGLTVSLGGAVITAKDNIIRPIKNAGQAHDGLLGKLYAADAGFNLHDAVKTYKNIGDVKKGLTLDVSIGSRSAKSDSRYQGTEAKESRIVSQGNIRIKSDEDIAVKGSQITGENVTLQAGKDINLTAAENRKTAEGNSRSKGAGITASFGIGGLQNVGISAGKSKGNMEEEIITHTGSAVTAKDTLTMESGKDLNITGSKAGGKKVEVKTGNNLSIESLQDSHTYHSRDKESGIHLQRDRITRPDTGKKKMDDPYFSIGKKTETTDSTYESVTKQAGIYAGKEGYDIQVKNNTHLKGAVIDSQAEKNKLTTGTLAWENIENKAEYKTGGHGISYNGKIGRGDKNDPLGSRTNNRYGKDPVTGQRNGINKITQTIYGSKIPLNERGLLNTPVPSVKGNAGTTTRSAIVKGTITITDKENQKQDIEKLNRNPEDSLNKLKEIFDKTKVEERKRLLEELGIVGNQAIHEIASHNGWKDGSAEKVALHGMLGAITGAKSGGSTLSGLIAGGANEYAIGYLEKTKGKDWINKHPDTVQNISVAFGGILFKMTGGSGHTGAYISQMGTKWNLEGNDFIEKLGENASASLTQEEKEAVIEFISKGMTKEAISYLAQRAIMDYPGVVKEYAGAFEGVRFLGRLNTAYGIASAIVWYYKKRYENRPDVIGYNEWIYNETGMDINYLK